MIDPMPALWYNMINHFHEVNLMEFNRLIPELTVSDIEQSKDFYIGKLGFTLEYERPQFAFVSLEGSQFMLEQFHKGGWNIGGTPVFFRARHSLFYRS